MTLIGYFMLKFVFVQQVCRALTFALSKLSCLQGESSSRLLIAVYVLLSLQGLAAR